MLVAGIILGVLTAAFLICGGVLYYNFARSPQKAWRDRVLQLRNRAQRTASLERSKVQHEQALQAAEEKQVYAEVMTSMLRTIPVDELQAYPGIGPATVAKLRSHGLSTLADLRDRPVEIPGLGEKRLHDISTATSDLLTKTMERFKSETSPDSVRRQACLRRIQAAHREAIAQAEARATAAEKVLDQIEAHVRVARRVNMFNYHLVGAALVPTHLLNGELPKLDQALPQSGDTSENPRLWPSNNVRPSPPLPKPPSREQYLTALEIDPMTPLSADLIRRQYNLLSERYDPAKLEHLGADFVALATAKRDAVRAAAVALLEPLGEPLEKAAPTVLQELRHNPDLDDVFGV